jgi:hypothetical protein
MTLETAEGRTQFWMAAKQAEQLAGDIFATRFGFEAVVVVAPRGPCGNGR